MCASDRSRPRSSELLGGLLIFQDSLEASDVQGRSRMISLASIVGGLESDERGRHTYGAKGQEDGSSRVTASLMIRRALNCM
jgi:hypothetical protein